MSEILKQTRSICSACGEIVPATYEVRDNEQVFFTRTCPAHGVVDTDLGYHAAFWAGHSLAAWKSRADEQRRGCGCG